MCIRDSARVHQALAGRAEAHARELAKAAGGGEDDDAAADDEAAAALVDVTSLTREAEARREAALGHVARSEVWAMRATPRDATGAINALVLHAEIKSDMAEHADSLGALLAARDLCRAVGKRGQLAANVTYTIATTLKEMGHLASGPVVAVQHAVGGGCLLYTSPSPRDATLSRMPSSA